jgi:plasmid maintenance system antidote protein VapI
LSDRVDGRAALSPQTALRTEEASGVSMDTRLRMPACYDSHTKRRRQADIDVERYQPV